jgi:hypothetical protein
LKFASVDLPAFPVIFSEVGDHYYRLEVELDSFLRYRCFFFSCSPCLSFPSLQNIPVESSLPDSTFIREAIPQVRDTRAVLCCTLLVAICLLRVFVCPVAHLTRLHVGLGREVIHRLPAILVLCLFRCERERVLAESVFFRECRRSASWSSMAWICWPCLPWGFSLASAQHSIGITLYICLLQRKQRAMTPPEQRIVSTTPSLEKPRSALAVCASLPRSSTMRFDGHCTMLKHRRPPRLIPQALYHNLVDLLPLTPFRFHPLCRVLRWMKCFSALGPVTGTDVEKAVGFYLIPRSIVFENREVNEQEVSVVSKVTQHRLSHSQIGQHDHRIERLS